jgi:capsular polysaccharide biosynthesis protein
LNEEELLPIIEKHGYTVLHGDEGIKTHINYFYSATKIIGFLGSLMRNCLFCSSNPRIVEYCSHDYFTDMTIKSIAEAVGVEWYRKISLEQVGNFDIVIEPWYLDKLLVNLDPDLKENVT